MKEFFDSYSVVLVSALVSLATSIIITILSHVLGNSKLRYEQRVKIIGKLSEKKYEGVTEIRSKIHILSKYEDLSITEPEEDILEEFVGKPILSPACCYNYEKLVGITIELNDLYGKYGDYLNDSTVVYLISIRNFLDEYIKKCQTENLSNEDLRWISVPIYSGIIKWYKRFNKKLINSINNPSTKYYAHSGFRYKFLLTFYCWSFKLSKPYRYINSKKSLLNRILSQKDSVHTEETENSYEEKMSV